MAEFTRDWCPSTVPGRYAWRAQCEPGVLKVAAAKSMHGFGAKETNSRPFIQTLKTKQVFFRCPSLQMKRRINAFTISSGAHSLKTMTTAVFNRKIRRHFSFVIIANRIILNAKRNTAKIAISKTRTTERAVFGDEVRVYWVKFILKLTTQK